MKTFQEFILECELIEGKVEWDNVKRPLQNRGPRQASYRGSLKEIGEGLEPLPASKMRTKIWYNGERARVAKSFLKDYEEIGAHDMVKLKRDRLKSLAQRTKKISQKLRNHDPVDSRFKEMENRDRGEKRQRA